MEFVWHMPCLIYFLQMSRFWVKSFSHCNRVHLAQFVIRCCMYSVTQNTWHVHSVPADESIQRQIAVSWQLRSLGSVRESLMNPKHLAGLIHFLQVSRFRIKVKSLSHCNQVHLPQFVTCSLTYSMTQSSWHIWFVSCRWVYSESHCS